MDGNAYITVGDPFKDQMANPFRQPKKGEKPPIPFQSKVRASLILLVYHFLLTFLFLLGVDEPC